MNCPRGERASKNILVDSPVLDEVTRKDESHLRVVRELTRSPPEWAASRKTSQFIPAPANAPGGVELDRRTERVAHGHPDEDTARPVE